MPGITEITPRLSADELTIYFSGFAVGGDANLYLAHRNARADAFEVPSRIANVNTSSNEFDPTVSPDALSIWFGSNRLPSQGDHLYIATRRSTLSQFGDAALATINAADTSLIDGQPFLTADGQELWFTSNRAGGTAFEIWRAPRVSDGFGTPVAVDELNTPGNDLPGWLSADNCRLYGATVGSGSGILFVATRQP